MNPLQHSLVESLSIHCIARNPSHTSFLIPTQQPACGGREELPLDTAGGEWFGYLNRDSSVSQRFKGGPYKGEREKETGCDKI